MSRFGTRTLPAPAVLHDCGPAHAVRKLTRARSLLHSAPILAAEDETTKLQPFTYAFNTLAVCASGGHLKRRHVVKLLEIVNRSPADTHSIGNYCVKQCKPYATFRKLMLQVYAL